MIVIGFGTPGSGKSTLLANFVQLNERKKRNYYRKNSNNRLYQFLTEPISNVSVFDHWYKEKIDGHYVTYAVDKDVVLTRKDLNKYCSILFGILFPKNFYDVIYCTDPTIQDTVPIDYDALGTWKPTWNSCIILEEAGVGMNCRNYTRLSDDTKELLALHRHKGADLLMISQTVDVDKAARQRSTHMFFTHSLGNSPFTFTRLIKFKIGIDQEKHELIDQYYTQFWLVDFLQIITSWLPSVRLAKLPFLRSKLIFRSHWYKYFDSFVDNHVYTNPDPACKISSEV